MPRAGGGSTKGEEDLLLAGWDPGVRVDVTAPQHLNRPDGANPGTLGPHFTVGGRIAWNINLFIAYKRAAINRGAS
ncbi:hypothetical protein HPB52_002681 [Rhipicephalus sanguineus]|uniref:Uncharacterized protein n=1 Tax=Rhipicephalus sanguineus TaxID=34632 RepID=A0A9D4QFR3_RHISA|nr:hypothetical protein HPB52_002681 [Rhipicephalus sanguineus]